MFAACGISQTEYIALYQNLTVKEAMKSSQDIVTLIVGSFYVYGTVVGEINKYNNK